MSSPQPVVPLDVVHCIFDQLQDPHDATSLSACSRACKLWLPLARKFLSAEMPVKLIGTGEDGEAQRRDTWGTSYSDWVEWCGFLKPQCVVLTAVKRLKISSMSPGFACIKSADLAVIIPCLPRLQHISIADATLKCPHPFQEPLLPSLRSLALRRITASMQDTVNFLHCLPAVQRVFFEDLQISRPSEMVPITPGERTQLSAIAPQSLCFARIRREKGMHNLVDFYAETNARKTLRYLEFRSFAYDGRAHLPQQMQNLETFVLSIRDCGGQAEEPVYPFWVRRTLHSHGAALESVHTLRRLALSIPSSICASWSIVPLQYATPTLQEVEIQYYINIFSGSSDTLKCIF